MGIADLDCDTYAEQPPGSRAHSKSFVAGKLNAAAVIEDPLYAKAPADDRYLTILTCAPMKTPVDALFAYDRFDNRGVIENSGNKQSKQAWKLGAALEKSEAAVYLHTFMVFMLMALTAAFRARQLSDEHAAAQGKETGMERYRREIERANRDKVLVRDKNNYAVLWAWEFDTLAGIRLRNHPTDDVAAIFRRLCIAAHDPHGRHVCMEGLAVHRHGERRQRRRPSSDARQGCLNHQERGYRH